MSHCHCSLRTNKLENISFYETTENDVSCFKLGGHTFSLKVSWSLALDLWFAIKGLLSVLNTGHSKQRRHTDVPVLAFHD